MFADYKCNHEGLSGLRFFKRVQVAAERYGQPKDVVKVSSRAVTRPVPAQGRALGLRRLGR